MKRFAVMVLGLAAFLAVGAYYAGEGAMQWVALLVGDGAVLAAWVLGALLLGAVVMPLLLGKARVHRSLFLVLSLAMGLGIFSLLGLGLGLAGFLNRATSISLPALSAILYVSLLFWRHGNVPMEVWSRHLEEYLNGRARAWWPWILVMAFLGITSVVASLPPPIFWRTAGDPHPYDVMEYHLEVPREWYQSGHIAPLNYNVFSYFPLNVEMHYLMGMHLLGGPWQGMYFAQLLSTVFAGLLPVTIYGLLRTMHPHGPLLRSVIAALIAGGVPWIWMVGGVAYVEAGLILYTTLAIGLTCIALGKRQGALRLWLVAGMMAGLACGVKYTAVPLLLVGVPLLSLLISAFSPWSLTEKETDDQPLVPEKHVDQPAGQDQQAGKTLAYERKQREAARYEPPPERVEGRQIVIGLIIAGLGALLLFSPWLIRNFAWAKNPVFPEAMPLLGKGHFNDAQVKRWHAAHSAPPQQASQQKRWLAFWREVVVDKRYGYLLWPLMLLAIVAARPGRALMLLAGLLLLLIFFWVYLTHLQSRFFLLGLPLAALIVGLPKRTRWVDIALVAAAPALLLISFGIFHSLMQADFQRVAAAWQLIGYRSLQNMLPPPLPDLADRKARLAMIGNVQPFYFSDEMESVRYRTVFDVPGGQDNLVDAWLGEDLKSLQQENYVLIDWAELERFLQTYRELPPLPANPNDESFIVLDPLK